MKSMHPMHPMPGFQSSTTALRLQQLRLQREELLRRLDLLEKEISSIETAQAEAAQEADLNRIAQDVEEHLGAHVIGRQGDRLNLRRRDERGDLLALVLAARMDQDGTFWVEFGRLREYLETVKVEWSRQGRMR